MSATLLLAQSGGIEGAVLGPAGIPLAFVLGMVGFFTPCILPLIPGYLSYMSGLSGEELEGGGERRRVLAATLLFVLGFAIVFTLLGASASALGSFVLRRKRTVDRIAGAIVVVMGLAFLSTLAVRAFTRWVEGGKPVLSQVGSAGLRFAQVFGRERSLGVRPGRGVAGALPLGAAFAVGWIPCVGPSLGTILTLAATEGSAPRGAALLFSFSLGFGVWFVLGGLAFRRATIAFTAIRRHMAGLTAVGGVFLLTIGVLLLTDRWGRLMSPIQRFFVRFTL